MVKGVLILAVRMQRGFGVSVVVAELARRAGYAGVLQPTIAAFGPALVAMVVGTTVLLFKEDGRT